jgi:hypothetical protein
MLCRYRYPLAGMPRCPLRGNAICYLLPTVNFICRTCAICEDTSSWPSIVSFRSLCSMQSALCLFHHGVSVCLQGNHHTSPMQRARIQQQTHHTYMCMLMYVSTAHLCFILRGDFHHIENTARPSMQKQDNSHTRALVQFTSYKFYLCFNSFCCVSFISLWSTA